MPAPFDKPEEVKIALVRYLSTGDFFQVLSLRRRKTGRGARRRPACFRQPPGRCPSGGHGGSGDRARCRRDRHPARPDGIHETRGRPARRRCRHCKVVAFDVNVENDAIPQVEQSDYLLGKMALDQALSRTTATFLHRRLCLRPRHRPARPPPRRLAGNAGGEPRHHRSGRLRHARQPDCQFRRQPGPRGAAGQPDDQRRVRAV